jgi:hypothetical protein
MSRSHTADNRLPWICGRCSTVNQPSAAICTNPHCGGEAVSRTVDAVAPAPTKWVHNPSRSCQTAAGVPKHAYASFDEAQAQCFETSSRGKRLAAYPCPEHGWHVGSRYAA